MDSIDVLCVGQASYDLVFSVSRHPGPDEKSSASAFTACGGGPAANAAVAAARLGCRAAFAGYLGGDFYGDMHLQELVGEKVRADAVYRGAEPTPLSVILVKPGGQRTVVNYRQAPARPQSNPPALFSRRPKVILFDGHEPHLSPILMKYARRESIPTVLDAGSVHAGTLEMAGAVDWLVASEKFARDFTGEKDAATAAEKLGCTAPGVVVTLGAGGLVWHTRHGSGRLAAFPIAAVDTTGAGDAFHGAFAAGLSEEMKWPQLLRYASAVAALTCTRFGARPAIPDAAEVKRFLKKTQ